MREKKRFGLFTGIAVLLLLAFASALWRNRTG